MDTPKRLDLAAVNAMSAADFAARFKAIAEHSPWVAEGAAGRRPFASREAMVGAFADVIRTAPEDVQLALVRAHPDLAGRAAMAGTMADESRREQRGVGLDQLSAEEFARFTDLNARYRAAFGFPFILAVRGATKTDILDSFAARIENDRATEFAMALSQIFRIIRFRLEDVVRP